jgi:DNA-binding response OmpR family regulator
MLRKTGGRAVYRILVCDDEKEIVEAVKIYLEDEGYEVRCCYDGGEALKIVSQEEIHLVLLDIMMPVLDGLSVARQIRKVSAVPILFITAKFQDTDKIIGLNSGADDYITKPFNPLELVARVKSNLRRYVTLGGIPGKNVIGIGGLRIDDASKEVTVDGEPVRLTPLEYNILLFLAQNKGRVFSIAQIYENVWQEPFDGAEKKVVVHISHIREKIEINPKEPRYLKIVWGLGYKMENIR